MYQMINAKSTTGNDESDNYCEKENAGAEKRAKRILIFRHTRYR